MSSLATQPHNSPPLGLPACLWLRVWIVLTVTFALLFFLSFCYEKHIIEAGGVVWNFFRAIFRHLDLI